MITVLYVGKLNDEFVYRHFVKSCTFAIKCINPLTRTMDERPSGVNANRFPCYFPSASTYCMLILIHYNEKLAGWEDRSEKFYAT